MNDVAITGIGIATPFGIGKEALVSGLSGKRGLEFRRVPEFRGTRLKKQKAAGMPDSEAVDGRLPRKLLKYMSKAAKIGCLAGTEAAGDAGIQARYAPEATAIFAASGLTAANPDRAFRMLNASVDEQGEFSERLFAEHGLEYMNPLNSFQILPNMPPCILSIMIKARGPNLIFNPWEEQGAAAILEGVHSVRNNETGCALVGAADTPDEPGTLVCLRQMNFLDDDTPASSAAAYLVLESRETAEKDGRPIYGVLHSVEIESRRARPFDPLAGVIGRTFAAAPALLLAANLLGVSEATCLAGTRGSEIRFEIERTKKP